MDLINIIKTRRSIRVFADRPIAKEKLENIVDAARFAASARNVQPWEFVVVTKPELLRNIAELAETGKFIAQAKACIAVFCADTKYYLEDGCAATQNILLAATSLGIGSCWVAGDKKPYCQAICETLKVPATFKLVSLIALGYPEAAGSLKMAQKRQIKELLHWEKF